LIRKENFESFLNKTKLNKSKMKFAVVFLCVVSTYLAQAQFFPGGGIAPVGPVGPIGPIAPVPVPVPVPFFGPFFRPFGLFGPFMGRRFFGKRDTEGTPSNHLLYFCLYKIR
jgi:hypothetical protein